MIKNMMDNDDDQNLESNVIFQCIACYFIHLFYNELYVSAKQEYNANSKFKSVAGSYRYIVCIFLDSMDDKSKSASIYPKMIKGIIDYVRCYENYFASCNSMNECYNRILCEFIPEEYLNVCTNKQKIKFIIMILRDSAKKFVNKLMNTHLSKVIDARRNKENIEILKGEMYDILKVQKNILYEQCIYARTKTKNDDNIILREQFKKRVESINEELKEKDKRIKMMELIIRNKNDEIMQLKELLSLYEEKDVLDVDNDEKKYNEKDEKQKNHEDAIFLDNFINQSKYNIKHKSKENIIAKETTQNKTNTTNEKYRKDNIKGTEDISEVMVTSDDDIVEEEYENRKSNDEEEIEFDQKEQESHLIEGFEEEY
jgi:hypothetical protein